MELLSFCKKNRVGIDLDADPEKLFRLITLILSSELIPIPHLLKLDPAVRDQESVDHKHDSEYYTQDRPQSIPRDRPDEVRYHGAQEKDAQRNKSGLYNVGDLFEPGGIIRKHWEDASDRPG